MNLSKWTMALLCVCFVFFTSCDKDNFDTKQKKEVKKQENKDNKEKEEKQKQEENKKKEEEEKRKKGIVKMMSFLSRIFTATMKLKSKKH